MPATGNATFNIDNIVNTFDTSDPFSQIDYIFYTKSSMQYISGSVLRQFEQVSDHLPIEMQFKLR
jgi:endonuclease/exonuclease/phosphatase family metal-dependent hydrolase